MCKSHKCNKNKVAKTKTASHANRVGLWDFVGGAEIAGLDTVGPAWHGWTLPDWTMADGAVSQESL